MTRLVNPNVRVYVEQRHPTSFPPPPHPSSNDAPHPRPSFPDLPTNPINPQFAQDLSSRPVHPQARSERFRIRRPKRKTHSRRPESSEELSSRITPLDHPQSNPTPTTPPHPSSLTPYPLTLPRPQPHDGYDGGQAANTPHRQALGQITHPLGKSRRGGYV